MNRHHNNDLLSRPTYRSHPDHLKHIGVGKPSKTFRPSLITLLLLLIPSLLLASPEDVASYVSARHDRDTGGYRMELGEAPATLAATNAAMRALRYAGVELSDLSAQRRFLLSHFDESEAAFVETGAAGPDTMANAMGLMLMAELGLPENRRALAAKEWLVEHAASEDETYMALAGMAVMGVADELPATWLRDAMDLAQDDSATAYRRARAAISCMRCGLNLPSYERFVPPFTAALEDLLKREAWKETAGLQEIYTFARALLMMDGRADLVPAIDTAASLDANPSLGTVYRFAVLEAWRPKLAGELRVAVCTGFAPVGYREDGGGIVGMDPDLMRAFATEHGYRLHLVEQAKFDGIWRLPARGAIDLALSGISKRIDRLAPGIRWSYPYFEVDRSLSILKENADRFRTVADLGGMKVAVTAGTTGEFDVRDRNPNALTVPYDNEEAAIADLLAGKVHALARGDVSNRWDALQHAELAVIDVHPMDPPEEFVVAVADDRVALGQKLDRFLREARKSGRLGEIFKRYLAP